MSDNRDHFHLDAERLHAFLDGELPRRECRGVEEHLASCAMCAAEAAGWKALFSDLEDLGIHRPHEGFDAQVMARFRVPDELAAAARLRTRLRAWVRRRHVHPSAERLQDFVDGVIDPIGVARMETHLASCAECARDATEWRSVARSVAGLGRFSTTESFADRVMAGVRLPAPSAVRTRAPSPSFVPAPLAGLVSGLAPVLARLKVRAGRLVPRSRKAWAALAGASVTPAVTVGLIAWVLFSHPTLTPGALASFAWWQASDLIAAAWSSLSAVALDGAAAFGLTAALRALVDAPLALAGGFLVYSVGCVLALRILYTNLVASRADGRYAQVSPS